MIALLRLMRPKQYAKNLFVFLSMFFGGRLFDEVVVEKSIIAFIVFCMAASSIYVINDLKDVAEDRAHPVKRHRPIASGAVSTLQAVILFIVLFCTSLAASFVLLGEGSFFIVLSYLVLNILYVIKLKQIAIVDIVCVALGFVLRTYLGAIACFTPISSWLVLMVFLLALFLVTTKRWDDLCLDAKDGKIVRTSLSGYNVDFLASVMQISVTINLVSYLMYCLSPAIIERFGTEHVYFTSIWVFFGFMRFLQIVYIEKKCPSPTVILYTDRFIQTVVFCWMAHFTWLIYF